MILSSLSYRARLFSALKRSFYVDNAVAGKRSSLQTPSPKKLIGVRGRGEAELLLLLAPSSPKPSSGRSFNPLIQDYTPRLLQTRLLATGIYNSSYMTANNPSKYAGQLSSVHKAVIRK
jgi:hypothetical protein